MKKRKKYNNAGSLADIYKDYNGSRFERGRSPAAKIALSIILFLVFMGLAIAAGYYVFNEPSNTNFKEGEIVLEIKGSSQINSGQEAYLIVDYQNNSNLDIVDSDINLTYPQGFIVKMTDPEGSNKKHNIWHFDKIAAGEQGKIKIQGSLIGDVGDIKEFTGNIKYNPVNTTAYFNKDASMEIMIESNLLDLAIEGTENFKEGEKNVLTIKYANNSAEDLSGLCLEVFLPEDISIFIDDKKIETDDNKYSFKIDLLEAKAKEELDIEVVLQTEENIEFTARIGYIDNGGEFLTQKEDKKRVRIIKGSLEAILKVNGSGDNGIANFGDKLNYSLVCKNLGNAALGDIEAKVVIDDGDNFIDWPSLNFENFGKMENKEIVWNKETETGLEKIKPGDEIELEFSIKIKSDAPENKILENNFISWAEITTAKIGDVESEKKFKSDILSISLNADLNFTAEAKYFSSSGEALGSGPLPPRVGETTSYKIFWKLDSPLHNMENIEIKANLPKGVLWNEKTSVDTGELYFDGENRIVKWVIPRLPSGMGEILEGSFDVGITPEKSGEGKSMMLLGATKLSGKDSITGASITSEHNFLSTNFPVAGSEGE